MTLNVGVIGTGGWSRVHLAALSESPHVDRIVLCGRNEAALAERASEFPRISRKLTDVSQLLADRSIDVVTVVLPHHLHASVSLAALEAGKHVICEKPAATSLADLDRVIAAAGKRQFLVVMNQLYNPVAIRVKELVESGVLGRPFLSVENAYSNASKNYHDVWRTTLSQSGGGVMIDGGFHMVYRHLYSLASAGPPVWVSADASQLAIDPAGSPVADRGEDFVAITIGFEGPLRIQWSHAWTLAARPTRWRQSFVAGTAATLEFTDQPETPLAIHRAKGSETIRLPPNPQTGIETTHACLLDYLQCLATGQTPQRATTLLARTSLAVILAAYESARLGKRVGLG